MRPRVRQDGIDDFRYAISRNTKRIDGIVYVSAEDIRVLHAQVELLAERPKHSIRGRGNVLLLSGSCFGLAVRRRAARSWCTRPASPSVLHFTEQVAQRHGEDGAPSRHQQVLRLEVRDPEEMQQHREARGRPRERVEGMLGSPLDRLIWRLLHLILDRPAKPEESGSRLLGGGLLILFRGLADSHRMRTEVVHHPRPAFRVDLRRQVSQAADRDALGDDL
eukprot:scaffold312_cov256-Pinguiococcus_pyrenoidosus.AAC.10